MTKRKALFKVVFYALCSSFFMIGSLVLAIQELKPSYNYAMGLEGFQKYFQLAVNFYIYTMCFIGLDRVTYIFSKKLKIKEAVSILREKDKS